MVVLADKEEIGSTGNTGLNSDFLRYVITDLARMQGGDGTVALRNSKCLSADVNAGADPTFQDVLEKRNASFTVNDFTLVCQFISCRSEIDFMKMYDSIGFIGVAYAKEKCDLARRNFINWWCNLDPEAQENIIKYVKVFYNK
jgi:hypothetical protein